jgi:hypothetical protein
MQDGPVRLSSFLILNGSWTWPLGYRARGVGITRVADRVERVNSIPIAHGTQGCLVRVTGYRWPRDANQRPRAGRRRASLNSDALHARGPVRPGQRHRGCIRTGSSIPTEQADGGDVGLRETRFARGKNEDRKYNGNQRAAHGMILRRM